MLKKTSIALSVCLLAAVAAISLSSKEAVAGRGDGGVIYVMSQGLYYDTFGAADPLPPHGPFQQLFPDTANGPATMYGPGDQGYVGGRWWVDVDGDGEMSAGDHYFLCPLLGPGREAP